MSQHDSRTITYSLGTGDNLGRSRNTKETLKKFKDRFREPHVTPEKYREYKAASDKRQRTLKGSNGWMMRGPVEQGQNRNRNSILPSQIVTLDIDYATPEFVEKLIEGGVLPGIHLIAHTTRSHTPENPRFRIIIFLKHELPRERYAAATGARWGLAIRRTGKARAAPQGRPRGKGKFDPHRSFFAVVIAQDGDITMPELASALHDATGVRAHPNAIGKFLRKLGYTHKKSRWWPPSAVEPM